MKQFLRYGMPSGLHYFVDISGFTMFLSIVGTGEYQAPAATNIAFRSTVWFLFRCWVLQRRFRQWSDITSVRDILMLPA